MQHYSPVIRAPAGAAAGVRGVQGNPQPVTGFPASELPGFTNALDAYYHQQQVGGYFPKQPAVSPRFACEAEYLSRMLCACLVQGLLNIQQTARAPSHISQPLSGIPFDRHIGTGRTGSADPPLVFPAVGPAGAFALMADFTVLNGSNGVLRGWGFDIDPEPERDQFEVVIQVNGQPIPGFDNQNGQIVAATLGWLGAPWTLTNPERDLVWPLYAGDVVQMFGRYTAPIGPATVDISARMFGWTYLPTVQTSDRSVRGTLTDQR